MPKTDNLPGLGKFPSLRICPSQTHTFSSGLGLAVVARIVEQLGGQLRVDSKPGQGSRFSFLIPFALYGTLSEQSLSPNSSIRSSLRSKTDSAGSTHSEIESIVEALSIDYMGNRSPVTKQSPPVDSSPIKTPQRPPQDGKFEVAGSKYPIRSVRVDEYDLELPADPGKPAQAPPSTQRVTATNQTPRPAPKATSGKLRVLIVEVRTQFSP